MELHNEFQIVGGTCQGRDHKNTNKNSHDAYHWSFDTDLLVAAVSDGCGSGEHSEVGAKIGVRIMVEEIVRHVRKAAEPGSFAPSIDTMRIILTRAKKSANAKLQVLSDAMGGSHSRNISNYFLFTVVGLLVCEKATFTFCAGDGMVAVNGKTTVIDEGRSPNYMSYDLVETDLPRAGTDIEVIEMRATEDVQSVMLATDGINYLAKACESKIPGKDELVGPVSQFWTEDRFFKNPFALTHRLNLINRESQTIDHVRKVINTEHGHLMDDTTIVVVRRKVRKP